MFILIVCSMSTCIQRTMITQDINIVSLIIIKDRMRGDIPSRRARGGLSLSLGALCTQYPPPVTEHIHSVKIGTHSFE